MILVLDKNFINFMHNKLIITETMNLIIVGNASSGKTTLVKLIIEDYYKYSRPRISTAAERNQSQLFKHPIPPFYHYLCFHLDLS